mgnify:FL=1
MNEKVKSLRIRKGMTQEELSKKAGISRQTLNYIETGKTVNITVATLMKLAEVLECKADDLVN